jgi:hypothetical protein
MKYRFLIIVIGLLPIIIAGINIPHLRYELDVLKNGEEIVGRVEVVYCKKKSGKGSGNSYLVFDYNGSSYKEWVPYRTCNKFNPGDPIVWKWDKKETFIHPLAKPGRDLNIMYGLILLGVVIIIACAFPKFGKR